MSVMVSELYRTDLATKADLADLRTAMAELKADLIRVQVTTMIAMTAIYGGLVAVLKLFA
jgi:hypothetical protein